jgi:hypothetical protein
MGKYIHTLKFTTKDGAIYTATVEDDNDDAKYKSVVNRVKTKIFDGAGIEVVDVSTVENTNVVMSGQNGSN